MLFFKKNSIYIFRHSFSRVEACYVSTPRLFSFLVSYRDLFFLYTPATLLGWTPCFLSRLLIFFRSDLRLRNGKKKFHFRDVTASSRGPHCRIRSLFASSGAVPLWSAIRLPCQPRNEPFFFLLFALFLYFLLKGTGTRSPLISLFHRSEPLPSWGCLDVDGRFILHPTVGFGFFIGNHCSHREGKRHLKTGFNIDPKLWKRFDVA